jgi:hypothetical protein
VSQPDVELRLVLKGEAAQVRALCLEAAATGNRERFHEQVTPERVLALVDLLEASFAQLVERIGLRLGAAVVVEANAQGVRPEVLLDALAKAIDNVPDEAL